MYNLGIYLYLWGLALLSLFDSKLRHMWNGEHATFGVLRKMIVPGAKYVWFHAASLGEFEQGRPLMERLRRLHPEYKILLTFFSPSGYEVRKNYGGADIVCYLPLDTPRNARRFIELVNPAMVFFIKYEFWYNYLNTLRKRGTPVYSVSSIFRLGQVFFRWYARGYARVLNCITHFYVQNEQSRELLAGIGVNNVTVTGDTRFDRVLRIKEQKRSLPLIETFAKGAKVFVAGSSWPHDGDVFIPYFNRHNDWKVVIAPHEIDDDHLRSIEQRLEMPSVRYTLATPKTLAGARCLIIDCYGLLSAIYDYATVAYVGGGFGVGIHNVLEAAVWGVPVVFGPNNKHFQEALGLIDAGGGFEVATEGDFARIVDGFSADEAKRREAGRRAADFVASRTGATDKILADVMKR